MGMRRGEVVGIGDHHDVEGDVAGTAKELDGVGRSREERRIQGNPQPTTRHEAVVGKLPRNGDGLFHAVDANECGAASVVAGVAEGDASGAAGEAAVDGGETDKAARRGV